jgi:Na+/H+-dicarboxylate symporter
MTLTKKVVLAMVAGITVGCVINLFGLQNGVIGVWFVDGIFDFGGAIFVKSLKLMVIPIVFFSLVCGVAALGASAKMGRLAGETLLLYVGSTFIALTLAVSIALIISPGVGADLGSYPAFSGKESLPIKDVLLGMFPQNPVEAMADGKVLQVIVFAILMGLGISLSGEAGQRILRPIEDINTVVMKMIMLIVELAPFGVFFLLAETFSKVGFAEIGSLAKYFFTLLFVLLVHALVVYPIILKTFSGLSPIQFFKNIRPATLFAFGTASSAATMPVTLSVVEKRMGVDNRVASFSIPLGATINMDGTSMMQGVATIFIAQAIGLDLTMAQLAMVILTATLASIGTAAVPSAGLVMLTAVFTQVGLPVEAIGVIFGVDRLLDMTRTAVNVTGDAMVTTIVAKRHGMFDQAIFDDDSDLNEKI